MYTINLVAWIIEYLVQIVDVSMLVSYTGKRCVTVYYNNFNGEQMLCDNGKYTFH